jgi:hypothetical protein
LFLTVIIEVIWFSSEVMWFLDTVIGILGLLTMVIEVVYILDVVIEGCVVSWCGYCDNGY